MHINKAYTGKQDNGTIGINQGTDETGLKFTPVIALTGETVPVR